MQENIQMVTPAAYLDIPCGRRLRGLPRRGNGYALGVQEGGKPTECPLVLGTSRCTGLIHACRLQTLDPTNILSFRKGSTVKDKEVQDV